MNIGIATVIIIFAIYGFICSIAQLFSKFINKKGKREGLPVVGDSKIPDVLITEGRLEFIKMDRPNDIPFEENEKIIMNHLINAHNDFVSLKDKHHEEQREWNFYFHGLQALLEHRILKRLYPKYFN